MSDLVIKTSPHLHSGNSTRKIMLDVCIALCPAAIAAICIFGFKALFVILVTVASALASEVLFDLCSKKPITVGDFSAVVTGLILALNLSTETALWQCAVGSCFAIVVVKCLFGGLGKNFANPAITGRVFMLLCGFAVTCNPAPLFTIAGIDVVSGATPLVSATAPSILSMLLGTHSTAAIGEVSILCLVAGLVYLLVRKVITWHTPIVMICTVFILSLVAPGHLFDFEYALYQILSGGLFLGAIFMATDYVTTPITSKGRIIFGFCAGVLTFLIRQFAGFPEGVSIAILIMNLLVPFIDIISAKTVLGGERHIGGRR